MTIIEYIDPEETSLSQRQRWAVYLSYAVIIIGIYLGITLRDNSLNQVNIYTNLQAGIVASYPDNWLLDEAGDYVFRVRDMSAVGFKTVIQVSVLPVSDDMVERNVFDRLSLNRSQTLIDYNILDYENINLDEETPAVSMLYSFVSRDSSPFLEGVSSVVLAQDILTIQRGQAIILTFRSDSSTYDRDSRIFEQFVEAIDY